MIAFGAADPLFHSVLEASPDCIRLLDVDGRLEFMNARGQALFEISDLGANVGCFWPDLWDPQGRSAAVAAVAAAQSGQVSSFRSFCATALGARKWWDTVVAPVYDQERTAIVWLLATSRDVTEEVETRGFLDTILHVMPEAMFVKDVRDGKFLLVNREAEALFGHTAEEMVGRCDRDFFPLEQAQAFRADDAEVVASRRLKVIEEEPVTAADGRTRYLRTKKVGTYDEEGPRHLVVISEDVTEARETRLALQSALERAETANRAKSAFLANMSHEVRTPLNGVMALSEMLSRTSLDDRQREMLALMQEASGSLCGLLTDILHLVADDDRGLTLNERDFDIDELVGQIGGNAAAAASRKGLSFRVDGDPRGSVRGDPERIEQLLRRLLDNAVKFTAEGEVVLRVGEPQPGVWRFEVRDTGIGFDPADVDRLFKRFEQGDAAITRGYGGSGLGLSVAQVLAARMGGVIRAEGRPGAGAVFTVEIPLAGAPAAERRPVADAATVLSAPDRLQVLLAEDNPTNRRIVELILGAVDVDLVAVENGALAVEEARSRRFDVILMDMQMPVMDGLTATRLIRDHERRHGRSRTPVICVSANALPQHVEDSRRAGLDMHLAKPITGQGLLNAIDSVLAGACAA